MLFLITEVLKQYGSRMSDYERQEIEKYPEVWYMGLESCKINAKPGTPLNCGYDDENGSYNKVSEINFDLEPWTCFCENGRAFSSFGCSNDKTDMKCLITFMFGSSCKLKVF